ncbi:MAG TPA: PhaM family polyhydroxyalkanoate granule multifunctional regulatory protein [Ramlibacter sp.]|uniref:PhaM family polyhydroxyalkanoate granule multifunctional regulatory protein n=1 Tax=Ramlibacter sp. TaxID=1917967 RepID=UPI002C6EA53F|nr:PhaM family polyhydroxyalkanoate granule multifunctional regulatory protein [Ramlibacter sp.]HVZ43784.1 PhaM family polyhydroxyalkanoate granule multifunctional regulatory protein [Ramlibacter sp.]
MSDPAFGFGKFVPGFDFLQNLAKGATQSIPQLPNIANWVAPTLNVEELEKRIDELKAVHFWLDQNSKALSATIQALEVQKMTLATLRGMNFNMGDLANALKLKAADSMLGGVQKATEAAASAADSVSQAAGVARGKAAAKTAAKKPSGSARAGASASAAAGIVDPLQWWGSLTQQFQQIAATAMKEAAQKSAADTAKNVATGMAKEAMKAAGGAARAARSAAGAAASSASARKPRARKKTA